jgi:hypothetical protein
LKGKEISRIENLKREGTSYEEALDFWDDGSGIFDGRVCVRC